MSKITEIRLSGQTYTIEDAGALHNLDSTVTSEGTNAVAGSGIYNAITAATNALAEAIAEEGYQNAEQVNSAITAITNPINNTLTGHTANTEIHVTVADKTAWNAKVDEADIAGLFGNVNYDKTTQRINFYHESTGGTVLAYIDASDFVKDAFLDTVVVENRVIEGESVPCLVFTWNTDAGKSETVIPIGGTFDPSNYYTKTEIDNIVTGITEDINEATSGKANTSDVVTNVGATADKGGMYQNQFVIYQTKNGSDSVVGRLSGGTGIEIHRKNGTYVDYIKVDTNTIQEKLTSGTNIKTVGGESLLGSGNINVQTLPTVEGTTLVFS